MTATAITYLAAQQHINDLQREAQSRRVAAKVHSPRRGALKLPRRLARRAAHAAAA